MTLKKKKKSSNFKVVSYPNRENAEEMFAPYEAMWVIDKTKGKIWRKLRSKIVPRKLMLKLFPRKWYQCAQCGNIYKKGVSDEDSTKEYKENFPNDPNLEWDRVLICDDCYKPIKEWLVDLSDEERLEIESIGPLSEKFEEDLEKITKEFADKFGFIKGGKNYRFWI